MDMSHWGYIWHTLYLTSKDKYLIWAKVILDMVFVDSFYLYLSTEWKQRNCLTEFILLLTKFRQLGLLITVHIAVTHGFKYYLGESKITIYKRIGGQLSLLPCWPPLDHTNVHNHCTYNYSKLTQIVFPTFSPFWR